MLHHLIQLNVGKTDKQLNMRVRCCDPFVSLLFGFIVEEQATHGTHVSSKAPTTVFFFFFITTILIRMLTGATPRAECPWPPPASSGSHPIGWTAWTAGTSANQRSGISGWSFVPADKKKTKNWAASFISISDSGRWVQKFSSSEVYQTN